MMEEQHYVNSNNEEKFNTVTKAIKTAAEMVHCCNIFQAKIKKIDDILCLEDKESLWQTLQEYLKKYGAFINNTTAITGFYIYQVSFEQYNAMTAAEVYFGICNSANRGYISSKSFTPIFKKKLSSKRG